MSTALATARAELEAMRDRPGFDEVNFSRFGEDERFRARHGLTGEQLISLMRDTRPKRSPADRFKWLEAVTARHDIGVRGLRTAVALFSFCGDDGFPWPSQRSLARRAGYEDDAEIRRGLASLAKIGAIRKIKVTNLPSELADKALSPRQAGGWGRSPRGTAYALVAPAEWVKHLQTGTPCPSANRDTVSLLNHQDQPPPASQDSFIHNSNSSESSLLLEPSFHLEATVQNLEGCTEPHAREDRHDAA